jgi:hypothetical protein
VNGTIEKSGSGFKTYENGGMGKPGEHVKNIIFYTITVAIIGKGFKLD